MPKCDSYNLPYYRLNVHLTYSLLTQSIILLGYLYQVLYVQIVQHSKVHEKSSLKTSQVIPLRKTKFVTKIFNLFQNCTTKNIFMAGLTRKKVDDEDAKISSLHNQTLLVFHTKHSYTSIKSRSFIIIPNSLQLEELV